MIRLIIALIILIAQNCFSAPLNVNINYDFDQVSGLPGAYSATADRSWTTFDPDDTGPLPAAPHLNAVAVFAGATQIGSVIDDPANRTIPISFDTTNPRPRITLRNVWLQSPWLANTAFALGDKISVFSRPLIGAGPDKYPANPQLNGYWECTRAGTTGGTEPVWANRIQLLSGKIALTDGKKHTLYGAVVDNGDGTVTLRITDIHDYTAGASVTIVGTTNYDGTYVLPDQSAGDSSHLIITHAYIAETFAYPQNIHLTAGVAVDNGDGTVSLPAAGHSLIAGDSITAWGTINYDGSYTLPDQTLGDADHVVITATFASTIFNPSSIIYKEPVAVDNGDGTVTLPAAGHGLIAGDVIDIIGSAGYAGPYTLPAQTLGDADHIVITETYTAESFRGDAYARLRIQDPDWAGVEWQYQSGDGIGQVAQSLFTGRIIIKDNGTGAATQTGTSYILRASP